MNDLTLKDIMLFFGPLIGVVIGGVIASAVKWVELIYQRHQKVKDQRFARLDSLNHQLTDLGISIGEIIPSAIIIGRTAHNTEYPRAQITPLINDLHRKARHVENGLYSTMPEAVPLVHNLNATVDDLSNGVFELFRSHVDPDFKTSNGGEGHIQAITELANKLSGTISEIQLALDKEIQLFFGYKVG